MYVVLKHCSSNFKASFNDKYLGNVLSVVDEGVLFGRLYCFLGFPITLVGEYHIMDSSRLWKFSVILLAPSATIVFASVEDGKANPAPEEVSEPKSKQTRRA